MPHERAVSARRAARRARRRRATRRWLLAQLLDYHRREAKPQWWEWFLHLELDEEELIEDTDTIGGLELVGEPEPDKSSLVYTFSFPEQEHKISGDSVDPATEKTYTVTVDDEHGLLTLRRSKDRADEPLPRALIPGQPIHDKEQREALSRLARAYLDGERGSLRSAAVLERRLPRARLDLPPVEAVSTIEDSYLFVQGPPGSGKTWQGAKMAVALMRAGQARRRHVAEPQGDPQAPPGDRAGGARAGLRLQGPEEVDRRQRGVALRGAVHRLAPTTGVICSRTISSSSRARRGSSRARTSRASSTRSSWTRRARCRSPTRWRSARSRATSSSSATRTSCRRSRRARSPTRRRCRSCSTCSASTRPCRRSAGSSSSTRGGCARRSARSRPRRTTRGACCRPR